MNAATGNLDGQAFAGLLEAVADAIAENREFLCELDGVIGDADHGITMDIGFTAVREAIAGLDVAVKPADLLKTAAKAFLGAVGASAGPLYASAFLRGAQAVDGHDLLDAAATADLMAAMAEGIAERGKAERGDKTMYDAWAPAAEAARDAERDGGDVAAVFRAAASAAEQGAESTAGMTARKGRSARLGERSVGHRDAGAMSTAIILRTFAAKTAT